MAVSVKFGTFALDDYIENWDGSVRRRIVEQVIPRKDGVRVDLGKLSGFEVSVTGGWEAASATALRTALNDLQEALLGQGKAKLRQFDDRHRWAQLADLIVSQRGGRALLVADFEARFVAEEPYEIADALSSKVEVITTDPQTFTATNGGTAPTQPVIKIEATAAALADALKLTNQTQGGFFSYHGTLAAGKTLVVDTDQQTVTVDGSSVIADFEGEFWPLVKGANSLKFDGDPCTVTVEWNDRWY